MNRLFIPFLTIGLLLFTADSILSQCENAGLIVTTGTKALGTPEVLDKNLDGYITLDGNPFENGTTEFDNFEALTSDSNCECEKEWTRIGMMEEPIGDQQSSSVCNNTDIITDDDGGQDHAYYTIIDLDGDCDTEDDLNIVFRIRMSDAVSGNFSFSMLVSNEGDLGDLDASGVQCCNKAINVGFEYEVQLQTGGVGAGVNVYDINGVVGTSNHGGDPFQTYTIEDASQLSNACGTPCENGALPIFYTFLIPISDLGIGCTEVSNLAFAPVTTTSGNPVIAKCSNVSDVGGVDDINNQGTSCTVPFTCPDVCSGLCDLANNLLCAASTSNPPAPVEFISFSADYNGRYVVLDWATATEINNAGFEIQRANNGRDFKAIGFVKGVGNSSSIRNYQHLDVTAWIGENVYRLKQIDFDGAFSYSSREIVNVVTESNFELSPNPVSVEDLSVQIFTDGEGESTISLLSLKNELIHKQTENFHPGGNMVQLKAIGLTPGIYLLQIQQGFQVYHGKLVVH